jgi:hypothetical protein
MPRSIGEELAALLYLIRPDEVALASARPRTPDEVVGIVADGQRKYRQVCQRIRRAAMAAKSPPASTPIRTTAGQNRMPTSGKSGAGMARGSAKLPTTAKTTPGNRKK